MDKLASLLQLKIKVRYTLEYFKGPRKTRYPTSALCSISTITTLGWIWFYNFTRAPPARACPPPPRSLRNCVEVGGCDKGITNTERGPTYHAVPTNRNHAMPLLTSSHLEGWDGSHRQVSCTITSTNLWQGDYRHSKFAFHDRLSKASVPCTMFQNWEPSTTSLLQTAR